MFKKIITFIFLALLTNCTSPGTAFLGPTFTGVKTGSVYQTSLSYGSGKGSSLKYFSIAKNSNSSTSNNPIK